MNEKKFKEWLDDRYRQSIENQKESQRIAPGLYGNGYDCGYLKAIQEIYEFIIEE